MDAGAFQLSTCMSFLGLFQDDDELSTNMTGNLTSSEMSLLTNNDETSNNNGGDASRHAGVVDYWFSKRSAFPNLAKVALRLLATPESSTSSEREFSLVKLSLSRDKFNFQDDTIDSKAILHSFIKKVITDCEIRRFFLSSLEGTGSRKTISAKLRCTNFVNK